MKRTATASLLSFVIPGAGLCYLGWWRAGIANLAAVTALLIGCYLFAPSQFNDYVHYLALIAMAGSAGAAHAVARQQGPASMVSGD